MQAPNWKGLMEWSIKNQTGTPSETVKRISDEDQAWLEEAMTSASVNVGQHMKTMKAVLDTEGPQAEEDVEQKEAVLEGLMEIVENIDYARDLQHIGGMQTLLKLLSDEHASIRWRAAEVIATCVQLNEPVQKEYLDANCMPKLLRLAEDPDPTCRQKSLLALSCLIRNNGQGLEHFVTSYGVDKLITIARSDEPRIQRKAVQLLAYIAGEQPSRISVSQLVPEAPKLLLSDDPDLRESSIALFIKLCKHSESHSILSQDSKLLEAVNDRLQSLGALKSKEDVEDSAEEKLNILNLKQILTKASQSTSEQSRTNHLSSTQPSKPLLLL